MKVISEVKCCKERCGRKSRDEKYHGQIFRINRIRKLERIIQVLVEKEKEQHEVVGNCQGNNYKKDSLNTVEHLTASQEKLKTN